METIKDVFDSLEYNLKNNLGWNRKFYEREVQEIISKNLEGALDQFEKGSKEIVLSLLVQSYKKGYCDALTGYSVWQNGTREIGSPEKNLKDAIANCEKDSSFYAPTDGTIEKPPPKMDGSMTYGPKPLEDNKPELS